MSASPELDRLARQLATEMGAGTSLEFEPAGGPELLRRAQALGYTGFVVGQLTAVDDRSGCEIVEGWNDRLGGSDVYRRPEATEIGVALGYLQDLPLTVVVVGVPRSVDPLRKRWPGVAPREWLLADFVRLVNAGRFRLGLPLFAHSEELDADAQAIADELLGDARKTGGGSLAHADGTALYYKGAGYYVADSRYPIAIWLESHRPVFAMNGEASAGVGLASRGQGDRLEAVWVLLLRPGVLTKE